MPHMSNKDEFRMQKNPKISEEKWPLVLPNFYQKLQVASSENA